MSKKSMFGVYIGRFQPFHKAHEALILQALENVQKIIIIVGSANGARTIKNPFTYEERRLMILESLVQQGVSPNRIIIQPIQDYFYNEQKWLAEVQSLVMKVTKGTQDITLLGHIKDDSSYYLKSFPAWDFSPSKIALDINATDIRAMWFEDDNSMAIRPYRELVPQHVYETLLHFKRKADFYFQLKSEYDYVKEYKEEQKAYPWPIIFVTVDPVVIRSGHILLVKRGGHPGKGLYALPGGFLNPNETIIEGTVRELIEETTISLLKSVILSSAKETVVFDHPGRSVIGRTVTHATLFDLGGGPLPIVKGDDDAEDAIWMPLNEALANPHLFMDDHWHIIHHFTMRF